MIRVEKCICGKLYQPHRGERPCHKRPKDSTVAKSGHWGITSKDPELEIIKSNSTHGCYGVFDYEEKLIGKSPFCREKIKPKECYIKNHKISVYMKKDGIHWPICLWCACLFYPDVFRGPVIDHIRSEISPITSEEKADVRAKLLALQNALSDST